MIANTALGTGGPGNSANECTDMLHDQSVGAGRVLRDVDLSITCTPLLNVPFSNVQSAKMPRRRRVINSSTLSDTNVLPPLDAAVGDVNDLEVDNNCTSCSCC